MDAKSLLTCTVQVTRGGHQMDGGNCAGFASLSMNLRGRRRPHLLLGRRLGGECEVARFALCVSAGLYYQSRTGNDQLRQSRSASLPRLNSESRQVPKSLLSGTYLPGSSLRIATVVIMSTYLLCISVYCLHILCLFFFFCPPTSWQHT